MLVLKSQWNLPEDKECFPVTSRLVQINLTLDHGLTYACALNDFQNESAAPRLELDVPSESNTITV